MPIIAYQSFNANSSHTHGLASLWQQPFTRDTNARMTGQGDERQALILPYHPNEMGLVFEGPAWLQPVGRLDTSQAPTHTVFGAQIALMFQNVYRAMGGLPDIMVCGELDASHADFAELKTSSGLSVDVAANPKANQSFTAFSQSSIAAQLQRVAAGLGFVAYKVGGICVLFVHVPNDIANKPKQLQDFYTARNQELAAIGGTIDLVIGDTNQAGINTTSTNVGAATSAAFQNAQSGWITPVDHYNAAAQGTNSSGRAMYDVAVYNAQTVRVSGGPVYLSQASAGVTVTDHCGVAVKIERI